MLSKTKVFDSIPNGTRFAGLPFGGDCRLNRALAGDIVPGSHTLSL